MRFNENTIEPSSGFVQRVMGEAERVEQHRRTRINIWFGVLALAPFAIRELWFLVRSDFFAVSKFPFSTLLTQIYQVFLSPLTAYALVIGGLLLATYVVGLPKWQRSRATTN